MTIMDIRSIPIDQLSEDELAELNQRIVERLKFLDSEHTHREMMQYSVGENVCFEPPGREPQCGVLVKYNKKTVTIITEGGRRWNVSPHLLHRNSPHIESVATDSWSNCAANSCQDNTVVALKARR